MSRRILVLAVGILAATTLAAQQGQPSNPYEGVSAPPADDEIVTSSVEPAAAEPVAAQKVKPSAAGRAIGPESGSEAVANRQAPNGDDRVQVVSTVEVESPQLAKRPSVAANPDGDMVQPEPLPPGHLAAGTTIRVKLLERLSTATTESGQSFVGRVSADVMQDGQLAIPAGSEIRGTVVRASAGRIGGRGSMRLRPETVVLPGGGRFRLLAELTGIPDSNAQVGTENTVLPNSRMARNGIEYGGAVGGGAAVGAVLGGPVGALTGGLVGAGMVTVHLLSSHPQAALEEGATLLFTLTEPLNLVEPERISRNADSQLTTPELKAVRGPVRSE